jgi:hypothetical protein
MSNVKSTPIKGPAPAPRRWGCLSTIGAIFLTISVGPLFFLLNGGYSIQGMAWLSEHTGAYGRMFWALATTWTIDVPIAARARMPAAQPILPWLMVIGMSFLQIGMLVRRALNDFSAPGYDAAGGLVSIFDYATTAIGLSLLVTAASVAPFVWYIWVALAAVLAIPITFGFEVLLARTIRSIRGGAYA